MAKQAPKDKPRTALDVYALPAVGSFLSVLAGLSFLWLCMLLPLVGKAGAVTPFARHNYFVFLGFLLLTLALSGMAIGSKMTRRRRDGSPPPLFTLGLAGISVLLLIAQLANVLAL
jgi:hypothetical protein